MNRLNGNNKLVMQHMSDFETMIILVEYYDCVLNGVNNKIKEDLHNDLMKEPINSFINTLSGILNERIASSQIVDSEIKRLVYNAQFTNAYTKLENALKDICDDVEGVNTVAKPKDGIDGIKCLLDSKKIHVDTDEFKQLYDKIKDYTEIRNCILHVSLKYKKLKFRKDSLDKRLILLNAEIYVNDSSYIIDFINDAKAFLMLIIKEQNSV